MFHRDAGYLEGRRVRRSRETRAMARRTDFGRELLAGQWAGAEFAALAALWQAGAPVPYPVQLSGTELMLEFIGDAGRHGRAAAGPVPARRRRELADLFEQCVDGDAAARPRRATRTATCRRTTCWCTAAGWCMIDLPQIVDLVANPQGPTTCIATARTSARWFAARGLDTAEFDHLFGDLMAEAVGPGDAPAA